MERKPVKSSRFITAVVMVGEAEAESEPVTWVQGARRAATADLLMQLRRLPFFARILLATPDTNGLPLEAVDGVIDTPPGSIHVGNLLAQISREYAVNSLLYFGGGAAPLLSDEALSVVVEQLAAASRLVVTNNLFASDWAGITPAGTIGDWVARLPRDNMLGWVLSTEAGLPVHTLPAQTGTRLDIDTPSDLLALRLHPETKPTLRRYLDSLSLPLSSPVALLEAALGAIAQPAGRIFIAGRLGPEVWTALNRVSRCWLRVVSEERGMVSSGRADRGEVRSLLAAHLEAVGLPAFFQTLADWADAAFIDTRVMLAHHRRPVPAVDRYASDLGRPDEVHDPWLRAFTTAAMACPIPIILGGHGLLAGDMMAFIDVLAARSDGK